MRIGQHLIILCDFGVRRSITDHTCKILRIINSALVSPIAVLEVRIYQYVYQYICQYKEGGE